MWLASLAIISAVTGFFTFNHTEGDGENTKSSFKYSPEPLVWFGGAAAMVASTVFNAQSTVGLNEALLRKAPGEQFAEATVLSEGQYWGKPWQQNAMRVSLSRMEAKVNSRRLFGTTGALQDKAGQVELSVSITLPYSLNANQSLAKLMATIETERRFHRLMQDAADTAVQNIALKPETYTGTQESRIEKIAQEFERVVKEQFKAMGLDEQDVDDAINFLPPLVSEFKPEEPVTP